MAENFLLLLIFRIIECKYFTVYQTSIPCYLILIARKTIFQLFFFCYFISMRLLDERKLLAVFLVSNLWLRNDTMKWKMEHFFVFFFFFSEIILNFVIKITSKAFNFMFIGFRRNRSKPKEKEEKVVYSKKLIRKNT